MMKFTRSLASFLLFTVVSIYVYASADSKVNVASELEHIDRGESEIVVVFESGFGTDATVWHPITEAIGEDVRTIAYSRAGLGGSPAVNEPRSIEQHISDLAKLLEELDATSNIVVVGHSYGGLLAAEMALAYPDLVIGLVLIDPATRTQRTVFKAADPDRIAADDKMLLGVMPPVLQGDYQILIDQMDDSVGEITPIPADKPTILYTSTADFADPFVFEETRMGRQLWLQIHEDLFQNVKDGMHVRVSDAGHNIHIEQPTRIARDIRAMVAELDSRMD